MKINRANFLTWDNSTDSSVLPINADSCHFGSVLWLKGDTMSFVVNSHLAISLTSQFSLTLCTTGKAVVHSFGVCPYFGDVSGNYFYHTITCPTIDDGYYILKLANDATTIYSNPIKVISSSANTAKFKFRHRFKKNKIDYTNNAISSFYQQFRFYCNFNEPSFQSTKDIIIDSDSVNPREYNHKVNYLYKINLLNLSLSEHQAAHDMVTCSTLLVNGLKMQPEGGYTSDRIRRDGRSNGSFVAYDYDLRYNKRI